MVDPTVAAIELADPRVADQGDVDRSVHPGRRHTGEPARKPRRRSRPAALIGDEHA